MTNSRHGRQQLAHGLHGIVAKEYADAAARTGDTTLTAEDKYKVAKQLDTGGCWLLTNHDPVTWQDMGAGIPANHATSHERSGSDAIDGDHLGIDFTPSNYTPDIAPPEAAHVDDLAAHLAGIDNELGPSLPAATKVGSSVNTTTTSIVDALVDSMTITPAAGTYLVWFAGSTENDSYPRDNYMSIYSGGVQAADSEVHASWYRANIPSPFCCIAKVTVNGAEAIEGRWRVSDDEATMYHRTLIILEVAA